MSTDDASETDERTVVYDASTGAVHAVGDAVAGDGEQAAHLPASAIARPVTDTFVDDIGSPTETAVDLAALKQRHKRQYKEAAYERLEPTDWYVVRAQETGEPVPDGIAAYRSAVRETEDAAVADVEAATSRAELEAITVSWPDPPSE